VIRLRRRTPASTFPEALGYSLPFAHRGAHVLIFYDRIEALAQRVNIGTDLILGYVMAHELGHVLLGSTEHTTRGLMQERWTSASWRLAEAGLVAFDSAEIKRMREGSSKFQVVERVPPPQLALASGALRFCPP